MSQRILPFLFLICLLNCSSSDSESEPPQEEVPPKLSMTPLTVVEGNTTKSIFLSLQLNKASENPVTVFFQTQDETATAGEDYIALDAEKVEFVPGDVQENLRLQIIGDDLFEEDETFLVVINQIDRATTKNQQVAIEITNDDISTDIEIPSTGYSTPLVYEGMELVWSDEFDGEELNETYWNFETGNGQSGWGNQELQYYRRDNIFMKDGHMVIQARKENFAGFNYTSSRIQTMDKFEFTFGRVDIRAVLPEGQGIWPALWSLGANFTEVGWPRCGEMDIMELVGHEPSTVHATVHYADVGGNRIMNGDKISLSNGKKFIDDFHVFSLVWKEDRAEFYMDDRLYHTITKTSLGSQNPYPFNEPFFFIMNVAVGGLWPGNPNETTKFPQNMIVDYIRVFQEAP